MAWLLTCTYFNVLTSPQRSSSCLVAHKASTESFHFSQLAAVVFTSSHDCHPASALSFSTVFLRVVFGTHEVYVSAGHFSGFATCTMLPLLYSVCTFQFLIFMIFLGVHQLPIQLGGFLLTLAPAHQRIALYCEDRPQCSLDKGPVHT